MRQQVQVTVSREKPTEVLRLRRLKLGARLLRALFGESRRVLVIIPGDNVEAVTVNEKED